MQFLILAYDGTDADAPARRQAVRQHHIALGDELLASGNLWYAAAITDDHGSMIGSMYMVDFADRSALDAYLEREPYVTGDVWRNIEIQRCTTRDPWQFNRPKEFFEARSSSS